MRNRMSMMYHVYNLLGKEYLSLHPLRIYVYLFDILRLLHCLSYIVYYIEILHLTSLLIYLIVYCH